MRLPRLLLILSVIPSLCIAQNFGANPPNKWAQINTPSVRVIFPRGMDSVANRIATVADILQRDSTIKYPSFKKINLVLQNHGTISNAYVALAPYRSEFYLTTPQNAFDLGSLGWADNLIIHEWRHVQQYNYFNRGLAKAFNFFLGQEGRALANALVIPDWYFEGDAVWNETKYSQQGRGRLPLAFSGYKSLFLEGKHYSYMKLRNGSYKDYVPGHYDLGYLLVAYGAEKYGKDFWNKVTADASAFKPLLYPLQGAIKKHAGISYEQFVSDAMNFYQKEWKQETPDQNITWLTPQKRYATDYLYPYSDEAGNIIAVKQSQQHNPAFYKIAPNGSEERIAAQDITLDRYFSYKNGRIVYSTFRPDARWRNREYSDIVVLDVNTKATKKIKGIDRKYFSPDISNDGRSIVAIDNNSGLYSFVVIMDENGLLQNSMSYGDREVVFSHPKFSADDQAVYVCARNGKGQMSLVKAKLGEKQKVVIPYGSYILGFPVVKGDTVLITASNKTNDAVYAYIESKDKLYQVASYPTGLYQSTLVNGNLVSSTFTSSGYRLGSLSSKDLVWKEVTAPAVLQDLYVDKALESKLSVENIKTERFSYSKYSTLTHPFNFHSWRPFYDPPEYSLTLYGQNTLNTVLTELAYTYNENENSHTASGNIIYGGTFLQPFIGIDHTWNRSFAFNKDTIAHWNELEWLAGLQLPLSFTNGKMYRFLNLSSSYHAKQLNFTGANKNLFKASNVQYLQSRLSFSSQIQKAVQHIYPRFALSGLLQMSNAFNVTARQFLASGSLYLPGVLRTHNVVLSTAFQSRDTMRQYGFSNNFPYPRGFDGGYDFPRMWKVGANYHFPLLYPDWGFANMVYFLRIRANGFTDYAELQSLRTGAVYRFQSAGGEVFFDTKWWNQLPLTFGIRYNYLVKEELPGVPFNQWEFILPVDIIRP